MLIDHIKKGDIIKAKEIIQKGADVNKVSSDGWSALMHAAHFGLVEVIRPLIEKGSDVHMMDCDRWNALMIAVTHGHLEIVKILIENGADIHAVDKNGWDSLMMAALNGHLKVVKFLIIKGADINYLFQFEEIVIKNLKHIQIEIEERKHLLTDENIKKWKSFRLGSLFS